MCSKTPAHGGARFLNRASRGGPSRQPVHERPSRTRFRSLTVARQTENKNLKLNCHSGAGLCGHGRTVWSSSPRPPVRSKRFRESPAMPHHRRLMLNYDEEPGSLSLRAAAHLSGRSPPRSRPHGRGPSGSRLETRQPGRQSGLSCSSVPAKQRPNHGSRLVSRLVESGPCERDLFVFFSALVLFRRNSPVQVRFILPRYSSFRRVRLSGASRN